MIGRICLARAAGILEYRRPSFGSFTVKLRPHIVFGIPRAVSFSGLELDIPRLDSIVVSKANDCTAQVAYALQSGLRQSAFEAVIPEQLFIGPQDPGTAVSAVKALALANSQGQRLYSITADNVGSVLPQLTVDADVAADIEQAVATGKQVVISQAAVTVGRWTGVGYILLDPETGAGAYLISGGANGGFFDWLNEVSTEAGIALYIAGLIATLAGPFAVAAITVATVMAQVAQMHDA